MFTGVRLPTLSREELNIYILRLRAVLDDMERTLAVLDDRDDLSVTTQIYRSPNRSRSRSASPENHSPNASPARNRSRSTSPPGAPQLTGIGAPPTSSSSAVRAFKRLTLYTDVLWNQRVIVCEVYKDGSNDVKVMYLTESGQQGGTFTVPRFQLSEYHGRAPYGNVVTELLRIHSVNESDEDDDEDDDVPLAEFMSLAAMKRRYGVASKPLTT